MTNEKAIELLKNGTMFMPTLENSEYPEAFDLAIKALQRERPQGKWEVKQCLDSDGDIAGYDVCCSECGKVLFHMMNRFPSVEEAKEHINEENFTKFCPNCGADMRGDKMINEEYLKTWEQDHIEFLTSREMGEWLYRRDKNRDKKERLQGEWIKKSEVICLLEKWADGYSYIEIPTTDAIKAVKDMEGEDNG